MKASEHGEIVGFTYLNFLHFCKMIGFELSMADAIYARRLGEALDEIMSKAKKDDNCCNSSVELIARFFWDRYGVDIRVFKDLMLEGLSHKERKVEWKKFGQYVTIVRARQELV